MDKYSTVVEGEINYYGTGKNAAAQTTNQGTV